MNFQIGAHELVNRSTELMVGSEKSSSTSNVHCMSTVLTGVSQGGILLFHLYYSNHHLPPLPSPLLPSPPLPSLPLSSPPLPFMTYIGAVWPRRPSQTPLLAALWLDSLLHQQQDVCTLRLLLLHWCAGHLRVRRQIEKTHAYTVYGRR